MRSTFQSAVVMTCFLPLAGCGPLIATGPNAVGVQTAGASSDESYPGNPEDPVWLGSSLGVAASYGRRLNHGPDVWLGPELMIGYAGTSSLNAVRTYYPDAVSRSFALAQLRFTVYPFRPLGMGDPGWYLEWLRRTAFTFGAGAAYERFSESGSLIDGRPNPAPITYGGFGPAWTFGLEYQISGHVAIRGGFSALHITPHLSFPWPTRFADKVVGGVGGVVSF